MRSQHKEKAPDVIFRDRKPTAVILDIDKYQEISVNWA